MFSLYSYFFITPFIGSFLMKDEFSFTYVFLDYTLEYIQYKPWRGSPSPSTIVLYRYYEAVKKARRPHNSRCELFYLFLVFILVSTSVHFSQRDWNFWVIKAIKINDSLDFTMNRRLLQLRILDSKDLCVSVCVFRWTYLPLKGRLWLKYCSKCLLMPLF